MRFFIISIIVILTACSNTTSQADFSLNKEVVEITPQTTDTAVIPGAWQINVFLPLLKGKKVALVVNHTSLVKDVHLLDTLLSLGIEVKKIFAPEHGFRGNEERGINFNDYTDNKTGIPVISLIGKKKKPSKEDLADIDIVVYDIQDVGVRFFTYISTMYYVMTACAENKKDFLILDRPNPNGDYIAGPVLQAGYKSFVGMLPIPVVYGMTPAELAQMINGEYWLPDSMQCPLKIIKIKNYTHSTKYVLPVKPSPNLPNYLSVRLYPSLCFFEATDISIGRGTEFPFQVIGAPDPKYGDFTFVPRDIRDMQTNPLHEGETCYGIDLRNINPDTVKFSFYYLVKFYQISNSGKKFFSRPNWIDLLAGTDKVRKMLYAGKNAQEIESAFDKELSDFKKKRKKYLLYAE